MTLLTRSRIRRFFGAYQPVWAYYGADGRVSYTRDSAAYLAIADDSRLGQAFYIRRPGTELSGAAAVSTIALADGPPEVAIRGATMATELFRSDPETTGRIAIVEGIELRPGVGYARHRRRVLTQPLEVAFTGGGHAHRVTFNLCGGGAIDQWWLDGQQLINRERGYGRGLQCAAVLDEVPVAPDVTPYQHNPTQCGDRKGTVELGTVWDRFTGSPLWRRSGPIVNADGSVSVLVLANPCDFQDGTGPPVPGFDVDHGAAAGSNETAIYDSLLLGLRTDFKWAGQPNIHRVQTLFFTPIELSAVGATPWSALGLNTPVVVLVQANAASTATIDELYAFDAAGVGTLLPFNGHPQLGNYAGEVSELYGGSITATNVFDGFLGPLGFSPIPSGTGGLIARRSVSDRGIGIYGATEGVGGEVTAWEWGRRRVAGTEGRDGSNFCIVGTVWSTNASLRTALTPLVLDAGWNTRTSYLVTGTLAEMQAAMLWLRSNGVR